MLTKTNILKDWYIERYGDNVIVRGTIYKDIKHRFKDGTDIITSAVLKADFVNRIIETRNSVYHLK